MRGSERGRWCGALRIVVPLAAGVSFAACGSAEDGAAPAAAAPPATPAAIQETAHLAVGVVSGDTVQEFDRVVTPFLLADGRLVVPVAGSRLIRIFAPDGSFVRTLGRSGTGPGEFRSLIAAWSRGDTIEALDPRLRRITRFLPDGSIDVVSLRTELPDLSAVAGPLPDGWIVGGVASAGLDRRDDIAVHRFSRAGADVGEIARVAGFARYAAPGISGPGPLSPRAILAVHRGRVYVAESLTPRITVLDALGTVEREITWEPASAPSASDALRVVVDSAVAASGPDAAVATRQRLEAVPIPEQLSVFWSFIVDDEGFIWVRHFEPLKHAAALGGLAFAGGGPGGRWSILSPEGAEVGTVEVPEGLELHAITSAAAVGIWTDAHGVESVRVHALRRR